MKSMLTTCIFLSAFIYMVPTQYCGCKDMNRCYLRMLHYLLSDNEEPCIESAEIGSTSVTIFLKALQRYCGKIITVSNDTLTYQRRNLYEVLLKHPAEDATLRSLKPVIFIEAGQQAGIEPVNFALYVIEQLVACKEHLNMLRNVRWVILPSTNPDGREYSRYHTGVWKKNFRVSDDDHSVGVDISRNFDESFSECPKVVNGFSPEFPGKKPMSENETMFITRALNKYKNKLRAYVSIKRDGHALLYPFGSNSSGLIDTDKLRNRAADIVAKINHKFGFIELLSNTSIYDMSRKPLCGNSVDFVYTKYNQPYAYEMRVFLETDHRIMAKFQTLPRGYDTTLRLGYFGVIKELYNIVVNEHKNKTISKRNV